MKRTVIIGASTNSTRYAFQAVLDLNKKGFEVFPIGIKPGEIEGIEIITSQPIIKQVHTVSIYLNSTKQKQLYNYILGMKPKRIIFNPGSENAELAQLAYEQKIQVEHACTLVLLRTNLY